MKNIFYMYYIIFCSPFFFTFQFCNSCYIYGGAFQENQYWLEMKPLLCASVSFTFQNFAFYYKNRNDVWFIIYCAMTLMYVAVFFQKLYTLQQRLNNLSTAQNIFPLFEKTFNIQISNNVIQKCFSRNNFIDSSKNSYYYQTQ